MISKDELVKMHDLCNAATPCPLSTGIVDPKMDPPKWFEEHLSFGSGAIYCVWCPEHPKTIDDKTGEPEHAVLFCITGNGPTSEVNAEFVVKARKWMPLLLGEIERLQAELDEKDRLLRSVRDFMAQYNECPECESKIGPEYACDPKCTCSILMEWLRTTV